VDTIFKKEDADILQHIDDDGEVVEPTYYLPVVPLIAINGCLGIGTGFSTDISPYNPEHVVALLKARLTGGVDTLADRHLDPWWFGFRGKTTRVNETTWGTHGIYEFDDKQHAVTVTELPVGTWSQDYKEFLDRLCAAAGPAAAGLQSFDDLYTDRDVKFVLYFTADAYSDYRASPAKFEKTFKLMATTRTTNMCCFNAAGEIRRYATVGDILEEFYERRLEAYEERRQALLKKLAVEIRELQAKRKFIRAVLDKTLVLANRTDEDIVEQLRALELPALSEPCVEADIKSYEYLLRMRIDRMKASAVIDLEEQVRGKEEESGVLAATDAAALWLVDLAEFEGALGVYMKRRLQELESGPAAAGAKKGVARKNRSGK
jgi:DNA topoisomerase-2